jgi:cyclopropane-fatty-acyl-phospholipid synthase
VARAESVLGVTLSEEQLAVARRRAKERGLEARVTFALEDYRKVTGEFDRIVSVGMFEHVGLAYYRTFFRKCSELLSPRGTMLLHTIGLSDGPDAPNPWLAKYIFPGGQLPALSEIVSVAERCGLMITDVEVLRLHYAQTVRHWRDRFLARRAEAISLYDERFCRMWEFYLSVAEAAFLYEGVVVYQVQLAREQDGVPLTRDYVVAREGELRAREIETRADVA